MFKEIIRKFILWTASLSSAGRVPFSRIKNKKGAGLCCLVLLSGTLLMQVISSPAAFGKISLSDSEKKELYRQGTEYFHQAVEKGKSDPEAVSDLYEKAVLRFERLVEEGDIKNGKLFYNIGNIHFMLDDIGRAILNYRRAELYIPHDPNLAKNLAYARSMRQDKLDTQEDEKILKTLLFFHYDIGTHARLVLFGFAYVSFWVFAVIKIFSRRPFTSWGLGLTLLFTLMFGASLYMENRRAAMSTDGVILAPEVIGRQGDAESYQPSFAYPLHAGIEFKLRENRGAWWQIELPDGQRSWIQAKNGELVKKK